MNFKKCATCESENPEAEVYCLECGAKLEPEKPRARQSAPSVAPPVTTSPPTESTPPAGPPTEAKTTKPEATPKKDDQAAPPPAQPAVPPAPKPEAPAPPAPALKHEVRSDAEKKQQVRRSAAVSPKVLRVALTAAGVLVLAAVVWRLVSPPDRLVAEEAAPDTITVAVMPFEESGVAIGRGYFGEGLAEALADGLNRWPGLRLTNTAPAVSGGTATAGTARSSRKPGAAFVLSGTFAALDKRLLVNVQLVEAADGSKVWDGHVDRAAEDVFGVLRDIAGGLVQALGISEPQEGVRTLFGAQPVVPDACDLYFHGRSLAGQGGRANLEKAAQLLEQAAVKDPSWAGIWAALANAYLSLGSESLWPPGKAFPPARKAVLRALELEPGLAEARLALAVLKWRSEWDFAAAEQEFREALRSAPGQTEIRRAFALFLSTLGRHEEAQTEMRAAQMLDPGSPRLGAGLGMVLYFARLYDVAGVELTNARQAGPADFEPCLGLGLLNIQTGDLAASLGMFQQAAVLGGDPMELSLRAGVVLAHLGRRQEVGKILSAAIDASRRTYVSAASLATVYAALLESDQAEACLEKALAEKDTSLVFLKVSPLFDAVRGQRWFPGLLAKTGF